MLRNTAGFGSSKRWDPPTKFLYSRALRAQHSPPGLPADKGRGSQPAACSPAGSNPGPRRSVASPGARREGAGPDPSAALSRRASHLPARAPRPGRKCGPRCRAGKLPEVGERRVQRGKAATRRWGATVPVM